MTTVVAVDVGGTFTDVSILRDSGFTMWKVPSTTDPVDGVLTAVTEGLRAAGAQPGDVSQILHATTVATNAIFERTGARVALLATENFASVAHIGREVRTGSERFEITLPKPYPFVDEDAVFEVGERVASDGTILRPLDDDDVRRLARTIDAGGYETVAVSLLHSYRNPAHELRIRSLLNELLPDVDVMLSHTICPEPGEYERTMTTVVSAYISPLVGRYVTRLRAGLEAAGIACDLVVVGSDGAGVDAEQLRSRPVTSLESGPVAGVLAGKSLADELNLKTCLTLDIGGTTSKAGLVVDGRIELTNDFRVGGTVSAASRRSASAIPVRVPVVDLAEMGVGGGSIAWVDEAGMLRVGPTTAGASPGPASFGWGGTEATVTDAAVAAGILAGRTVLGTQRLLDSALAFEAFGRIGSALGLDAHAAALAVREVASAEIAAAIQRLLFYRGVDPAKLTLMAFGGTGPLHAADVADIVGVGSVVVPAAAGVFTTFGLLCSEIGMEQARHVRMFLTDPEGDQVERTLAELEVDARRLLDQNETAATDVRIERSVDLRFRHQVQTLPLNLPAHVLSDGDLLELFRQEYQRQFGLSSDHEVEVVQLRVRATQRQGTEAPRRVLEPVCLRRIGSKKVVLGSDGEVEASHLELVASRSGPVTSGRTHESIRPDGTGDIVDQVDGPALIDLAHTTAVVPPGWTASVLPGGDLSISKQ